MKIKLLLLAFIVILSLPTYSAPLPVTGLDATEVGTNPISVVLSSQSELRITGAAGEVLSVYNVAGVRVLAVRLDSQDKTVTLNLARGCYIVKVGNVVRKISLG